MPKQTKPTLTAIPPLVFSAMLKSNRDRADRDWRQNRPCNDGRTGIIVDYSLGLS